MPIRHPWPAATTLRRRGGAVVATATLLCALAACSDGDDDASPPEESTAPTAPASTEPGASESAPPPSEPAPTPTDPAPSTSSAPALGGPEIGIPGQVTLTAPEGWEDTGLGIDEQAGARSPDGVSANQVLVIDFPLITSGSTLDSLEQAAIRAGLWDEKPERLDRVEVDGVEMSHLRGTRGSFELDEFLAVHNERQITITFTYDVGFEDPAQQRELYESILATVVWE